MDGDTKKFLYSEDFAEFSRILAGLHRMASRQVKVNNGDSLLTKTSWLFRFSLRKNPTYEIRSDVSTVLRINFGIPKPRGRCGQPGNLKLASRF